MPRSALKCSVDFKLQALTCPGVWLPNKDDVYISVCLLGQHRRTPLVSSVFPLLFYTEMDFSKVFWTAVDPTDVVDRLEREHVYIELVQLDYPSSGTVLAKYESNLRDFLFPYPSIAPKTLKDRDILMEKTIDFPNGISPRLEFSCTTHINETPTPYTDAYESATTGLDDIRIRVPSRRSYSGTRSPPPRSHSCTQDHIGQTHRPTHDFSEDFDDDGSKRPFVVRRVDKDLIHRMPGGPAPEPFPTATSSEYRSRSRSRSRTRSAPLRTRSASPARSLTRGLYGVYNTRPTTPDPTVHREPRRSYLDSDDVEVDAVLSRYRARTRSPSPSYYERLRKQLDEEDMQRRIQQRVRETLRETRPLYTSSYYPYYYPYYYYNYPYYPYSYRYRYPYTTEALDKLTRDLELARIRSSSRTRYYP